MSEGLKVWKKVKVSEKKMHKVNPNENELTRVEHSKQKDLAEKNSQGAKLIEQKGSRP
jgi:hypothetical protein